MMPLSRYLTPAIVLGLSLATSSCAQGTDDAVSNRTADTSRNIAEHTVDTTRDVALAVATTTRDAAVATGEAVTDAWITTHVGAKFADETLLEESNINVDTNDHVVTLKGTVKSAAGRTLAAAIARETQGVTRVVNQIVVK